MLLFVCTLQVEKELKEKAQAQQQIEQQQHKPRSGSGSTPLAVRQAEETAKKVMELNAASGAAGVQRGLAESLCLTGNPTMDSVPLKDLVVQLPKLLSNPDLAAATQSLLPSPAFALTEPFLQSSASSVPSSSPSVPSSGASAGQVQPPASLSLQQPLPTTVVSNGNNSVKAGKGRGNAGKAPRSTGKGTQQQPPSPLPPPPPQQPHQPQQLPTTSVASLQAMQQQYAENGQGEFTFC